VKDVPASLDGVFIMTNPAPPFKSPPGGNIHPLPGL
jgi:hypothetical protein